MSERIRIDHGNLAVGKRKLPQWKVPASVKRELLRFLDDLAMGKVNRGRRISPQRQLKYLHALRAPLEFFNKPTARLTLRDIEKFERALESGQQRSMLTGQPYAHSTKADMRMLLKIFLRWRLGASKAARLSGWLDTRLQTKTPAFLKESEVKLLYKNCRDSRQRFLVAVLFDSGARAEEFHNIRFEDIELPEGETNFVRVTLKEEYSKTKGRTISLYWPYTLEAVRDYLNERRTQGIKPTDPVFVGTYGAMRKVLQRLGIRVLNRPVHYHLIRHSSATFYANKFNRQELCLRYGWRFSSTMPDVYISRSGMVSKDIDERFTQTELSSLKTELTELRQQEHISKEQVHQMQGAVNRMAQQLEQVSEVLRLSSDPDLIRAALDQIRRRDQKA